MKLFLVRHGSAVAQRGDSERPLSHEGVQEVQRTAQYLKENASTVRKIYHSSKQRAIQTAEMIKEVLNQDILMSLKEGLLPNDATDDIFHEINSWDEDTMIVGHLPFLPSLASRLIESNDIKDFMGFAPAAVATLEKSPDGKWCLISLIKPKF